MSATALVRRPSSRLAEGIVSHIERRPVDVGLAIEQWEAYGDALRTAGWRTVEVPAADDCPDSVFVEDTMVVYGRTAVIAQPSAPARRAETAAAEEAVRGFGYEVHHITTPGTLDGGDILKVGDIVYVAHSGRTNGEGIRQLRAAVLATRPSGDRLATDQGSAPQDGGDGAAGRDDHRLASRPRRSGVLPSLRRDAGGIRFAGRRSR